MLSQSRRGSSPLARGLLFLPAVEWCESRIIPARAGFTVVLASALALRADHPRSRGVYTGRPSIISEYCGSSPLARGLLEKTTRSPAPVRIIPARAGFTQCSIMKVRTYTDHPRSRGVYVMSVANETPGVGSSPLARGLPRHDAPLREIWGIIPARAGFTARCGTTRPTSMDHPRSRGVYPATRRPKIGA